jgi:hypothetical protein
MYVIGRSAAKVLMLLGVLGGLTWLGATSTLEPKEI